MHDGDVIKRLCVAWHRTVLNLKVCMKEEVEGRSEQIHGRQELGHLMMVWSLSDKLSYIYVNELRNTR